MIAQELDIPSLVVFGAEGYETNEKRREHHERDNKHLMAALNIASNPFPAEPLWGDYYAVWPTEIENQIKGNRSISRIVGITHRDANDGRTLVHGKIFQLAPTTLLSSWPRISVLANARLAPGDRAVAQQRRRRRWPGGGSEYRGPER